jgi:cellulose synthase/poly-beta-1,6-N-acetylglucosamine synthase-like glycosyltransferase
MYNAESHIKDVLSAIFAQDYPGQVEVIVVNDGSTDSSLDIVRGFEGSGDLRILDQENQGAVAATNNGLDAAKHDIICSVDSDVVLKRDWLAKITEEFDDPLVGAAQGYYKTPAGISFWARMMGYDVEARYDAIRTKHVSQVCTGNTAYRREAIEKVGLFDPAFTYGYDNDMSYRLQRGGYKLVFRKDALCDHFWKADLVSYLKQQYRSAYGRMQLVRKHTDRVTGDSVSGLRMILQAPLTLLSFLLAAAALAAAIFSTQRAACYLLLAAVVVFGSIVIDRVFFALGVYRKQKDPAALLLPFVHLLRNAAWVWASLRWGLGLK